MNPTSGSRITFNTLSPFLHLHLLSRTIKASISNIFPLILPNGNLISTLTFFFFLIDSTFTLMIHQKKIFSFLGDTSHLLLWTKKSFAMNKTDFSSSKSILRFPSKRRSLPYFCHPYWHGALEASHAKSNIHLPIPLPPPKHQLFNDFDGFMIQKKVKALA